MQIDIISDTVCPWCYIGKRKLEKALWDFKMDFPAEPLDVTWRPYMLDPTIPHEGVERKAYMAKKFGGGERSKQAAAAIIGAGKLEGINFAFDKIEKSPNTMDSHRLIQWAGTAGVQHEVVSDLFAAFFELGLDIGDADVLVDIAEKNGMDADLVRDLLAKEADYEQIRQEIMSAQEMGITGVPAFVIDQKFSIPGAQEPETILRVLTRVMSNREKRAAEAAEGAE